jgi:LPS export ABC transporter protein LptC
MKLCHPYKLHLIAALLSGCFFISSCENSEQELKDLTSKRIGVEEAKSVSINYSLGGKIKALLTAPYMLRYQDTIPYIEFTKTVHSDFYDAFGKIESRMDAKYARYMEAQSKVFLKDSVRVFNQAGDTLYCMELYWDRARVGSEFYTDKPVRIRTKSHIIDGIGLDAPQDFKSWHIVEGKGFVKVPASQFPN